MNIQKLTIIFYSIFIFLGCSKSEITNEIPYQKIGADYLIYSDEEKIQKQFIRFESKDEWLEFIPIIERVNPVHAESLKKLSFNFIKNDLIIVIGDFFYYCCSDININRIYRINQEIYVDFEETGPGQASAISQAYQLLQIKKEE